jgi:hypothetical protein
MTAQNKVACDNTVTAAVRTVYAISNAGAISSSSMSAPATLFTGTAGASGNCDVPGSATVTASVAAGATTPLGTYSISLSTTNGTVAVTNSYQSGGKLDDNTATTLTFRVVPPANRAPAVTTLAGDVNGAEGSELASSGRFTDPDGDALSITKLSGSGTVTPSATTPGGWSWALTPSDEGSGTVVVRAHDGHGGSVTDSFDWSASNVAPVLVTAGADATGVEGATLTAGGSFTDVAGDLPLTITKVSGPGTLEQAGDGGWSWSLATTDDVSDTVVVRASDGDGGVTEDSFAVIALNVKPGVATDALDVAGDEGSELSNGGAFSDVDELRIDRQDGPGVVTDNRDRSWSWSYTPDDDGTAAVTVAADDGDGGTETDSFQVRVNNVAPALVAAANDAAGAEGTTLSAGGGFTDVAADPIEVTKVSGAGTVTNQGDGTWTWSHTPGDDGAGTVVVQADDGDGGVTRDEFGWTATNADPTVQDAAQPATGTEGNALATGGSFTDVPADTLTITKDSGPGTLTDNGDGTWTWSLPTTDDVTGSVVVRATDDDGGTTTDTFTYTATNVAPAIVDLALTGATGTACLNGSYVGVSFTVGDPAGSDTITGTVNWGDGQSQSFSGRAVNMTHVYAAGNYVITVNAKDDDGGQAVPRTASVARTFQMSAIQAPFNTDGSSIFKAGSTVPVKVRITDCLQLSVPNLAPTIRVALAASTTPSGSINETPESTSSADTTGYLRYDSAGAQYIYNMATKSLPDPNAGYKLTVAHGTVEALIGFSLRSK